jgi:hypothetical protein
MTMLTVSGAVVLLGVALAVFTLILAFTVPAWRELAGPRRPRPRARPPRRAIRGPGMPVPYWEGREGPPAFLIAVRPTDGHTVTIDPVAAEWATEWPEPKPWSPWELATGEFPAIIERMGR